MKKQNKTFAQRARDIQSKYKRLEFDSLEQKEFEAEMEKLQQEQEQVREMLGLNQQEQPQQIIPQGQFTYGGKLMMDGFERTQVIPDDKVNSINQIDVFGNSLQDNGWNNVVDNITNYAYKAPAVPMGQTTNNFITTSEVPIRDNKYTQNLTKELNPANADINKLQRFWDANKQYAPYAISGISNTASNLLLANMAKKNQQKINPIFATPNKINLEPQAEQFRKDASVSKNIGLRQARDLGTNAGTTLANIGAIGSGVDRQLAGSLTNLYGQQEQYNVGTANQFNLRNQEIANRTNMINSQFNQQANQDRLGFISGALGTIPGVMKDIRMDKADAQMRDVMDRYYKSIGGRNYATVGSIFKDPASGFTYKVKPDLTLEKVK